MRWTQSGLRAHTLLCVCLLLASGCGARPQPSSSPADAVRALYAELMDRRVSGAPTEDQLVALRPLISTELHDLLREARRLRDDEADAHPDEKPPFAEGDLFTSLFEGATGFEIIGDEGGRDGAGRDGAGGDDLHRIPVRFSYGRETPAFVWTDTVVVLRERGRWVVGDVRYGGAWDFANGGGLVDGLRGALEDDAADAADAANAANMADPASHETESGSAGDGVAGSPLVLRFDRLGPVRMGMTVAQVRGALGGTARVDRIDPGESCGHVVFSALPEGLSFMVAGDTVVRAEVRVPGVWAEGGGAVGMLEAEVLSRYRGRVRVEPHPYMGPEGHYLVVDDAARRGLRMIFETDGSRVTAVRAGRLPEVDLIEGCA
jgi:hypothetical protein